MLCAKLIKTDRVVLFLMMTKILSQFSYLEKGVTLHLKKIETPSRNNLVYKVWIILNHGLWRRNPKNYQNIFIMSLVSSLEEVVVTI